AGPGQFVEYLLRGLAMLVQNRARIAMSADDRQRVLHHLGDVRRRDRFGARKQFDRNLAFPDRPVRRASSSLLPPSLSAVSANDWPSPSAERPSAPPAPGGT